MRNRLRLCRVRSKMLNDLHGDSVDGGDVLPVKQEDVETGRKGQSGQ